MLLFYVIDLEQSPLDDTLSAQHAHKYVWAGKDFFSQTEVVRSAISFEGYDDCHAALEMFIGRMKIEGEVEIIEKHSQ